LDNRDDEWNERITSLNETYDEEFMRYKEYFHNKERLLEEQKENIERTLKHEIDQLKQENIDLEEIRKTMEKKILESEKREDQKEGINLISQIDSNNRLSYEKDDFSNSQKKMEKSCQTMNVDRRDIENIIVENKDTQTFTPENDMKETRDTHDQISETYQGLRQRNKKKKMKRRHSDHKLENPHVVSMTKEDEKKINRPMMSYGNLYTTNWNPVFSMAGTSDHVIDIYDEEIEQDNNFFLSMDSCFKNRIMDPLEEHKDYNLSETQSRT
jgi:hypothetical protein